MEEEEEDDDAPPMLVTADDTIDPMEATLSAEMQDVKIIKVPITIITGRSNFPTNIGAPMVPYAHFRFYVLHRRQQSHQSVHHPYSTSERIQC